MKWRLLLLCALCVGLLSGCNSEKTIDAQVLYANPAEEALHLWVETEEKEMIGIFVEEDAHVFSFIEDADLEAFWAGELENVQIRANCAKKPPVKLEDGKEIMQYAAKQVEISGLLEEDGYTLKDGTKVDLWTRSDHISYVLDDGEELLRESVNSGETAFPEADPAVNRTILEYYDKQGVLYDVPAALEKAYEDYCARAEEGSFQSHLLEQTITPTAYSESVLYYETSVLQSITSQQAYDMRIGTAFARESGEVLDTMSLFSCDQETLMQAIFDRAALTDAAERSALEQAFDPRFVSFYRDNLQIAFPKEEEVEYSIIVGMDYEELTGILHDWAIPVKE